MNLKHVLATLNTFNQHPRQNDRLRKTADTVPVQTETLCCFKSALLLGYPRGALRDSAQQLLEYAAFALECAVLCLHPSKYGVSGQVRPDRFFEHVKSSSNERSSAPLKNCRTTVVVAAQVLAADHRGLGFERYCFTGRGSPWFVLRGPYLNR